MFCMLHPHITPGARLWQTGLYLVALMLPAPLLAGIPASSPIAHQASTFAPSDNVTSSHNWVYYLVKPHDNLTSLFRRAGLTPHDVYNISHARGADHSLTRLRPGQQLGLLIVAGKLRQLRYAPSALRTLNMRWHQDHYQASWSEHTPTTRQRFLAGQIEQSLFVDGKAAGMTPAMVLQYANIFSWDIDFTQDIQPGDQFQVLYNEQWLGDQKIHTGHIVAARFISRHGHVLTAIRHTDAAGNSHYFTPQGDSMQKAFLRMPVDFTRISSGFNLARRHPLLNRIRAHTGVDYAAPSGTPIKASGDGKIIWLGHKRGYGRTIVLQHGGNISTLYAHLSKYHRSLKSGDPVSQGQIIGYVGQSGLATGPHLHYEFRIAGQHKNPITVTLPRANPIPSAEKQRFTEQAAHILTQLASYSSVQLASMEQAP